MRITAVIVIAAGALAATLAPARATVCENKRGKLTVRGQCKKKEKAVTVDDIFGQSPQGPEGPSGPGGPQGPGGPPGSTASGPVRVLDNANKEVGVVLSQGYYGGTTVLRNVAPDWFNFDVSKKGYVTLDDDVTFFSYEDAACAGPKFVYAGYGATSPDNLSRRLVVGSNGTTGYSAVPTTTSEPADVFRPYTESSSVGGAFLSCGSDTAIGSASACDPARHCGSTAKCFCLDCCPKNPFNFPVTTVQEVDVGAFGNVPPFHLDR
jgi:hypothetical protein